MMTRGQQHRGEPVSAPRRDYHTVGMRSKVRFRAVGSCGVVFFGFLLAGATVSPPVHAASRQAVQWQLQQRQIQQQQQWQVQQKQFQTQGQNEQRWQRQLMFQRQRQLLQQSQGSGGRAYRNFPQTGSGSKILRDSLKQPGYGRPLTPAEQAREIQRQKELQKYVDAEARRKAAEQIQKDAARRQQDINNALAGEEERKRQAKQQQQLQEDLARSAASASKPPPLPPVLKPPPFR